MPKGLYSQIETGYELEGSVRFFETLPGKVIACIEISSFLLIIYTARRHFQGGVTGLYKPVDSAGLREYLLT